MGCVVIELFEPIHQVVQAAESHFHVIFQRHGDLGGQVVGAAVPEKGELVARIGEVAGVALGQFLPEALAEGARLSEPMGLVVAAAAADCAVLAQHAVVEEDPAQLGSLSGASATGC